MSLIAVRRGLDSLCSLIDDSNLKASVLNVAFNNLTDLSGIDEFVQLKLLNISNNRVSSLNGIELLQSLQILHCSHNCLFSLTALSQCRRLQELWLSHNSVSSLQELLHLRSLPITILVLSQNPVCSTNPPELYRAYVVHHFPHLQILDGIPVTEQERVAANQYLRARPELLSNLSRHSTVAAVSPSTPTATRFSTSPLRAGSNRSVAHTTPPRRHTGHVSSRKSPSLRSLSPVRAGPMRRSSSSTGPDADTHPPLSISALSSTASHSPVKANYEEVAAHASFIDTIRAATSDILRGMKVGSTSLDDPLSTAGITATKRTKSPFSPHRASVRRSMT
eukprot:GILJ01013312.1.p1 GENE.GILJ01013312.1~~GILJ01013312.1.p1  ORF type:complete len:344 (-),score=32.04 GILJ01013312.1:313-1320(-)